MPAVRWLAGFLLALLLLVPATGQTQRRPRKPALPAVAPAQAASDEQALVALEKHILDAIRDVHHAIETYSAFLPGALPPGNDNDDDIPF